MGSDAEGNFVRSEMVNVILKDGNGNEIDRMSEPILKSEFEKLSSDFTHIDFTQLPTHKHFSSHRKYFLK